MDNASITGKRACPLCARAERSLLFRRAAWEVAACANCTLVYVADEVSYDTQASEHDFLDTYIAQSEERRKRLPVLMFFSRLTRRLKPEIGDRLLRQTLRWRQSGRLLDVGCGDGKFLEKAAKHFEVTGVEISARLAAMARARVPGIEIVQKPLTEAALPGGAFDVVTLFSVLEHEWHPLEALQQVYHALKPGGVTVLKVPNHASWNRRVMGQDWCGYRLPDHCNYFTPRTLRMMLERAELRPLRGSLLDRLPTSDSLWMAAEKGRN